APAEHGPDVLVRLAVVRELHPLRIPQQLARNPGRDRAENHPLRVRTGDREVRARGLAAFARAHPVALMTGRARQASRRQLVFRPTGTWQEADALAATPSAQEALRADEDGIVAASLLLAGTAGASPASGVDGGLRGTGRGGNTSAASAAAAPFRRTVVDLRDSPRNCAHLLDRHPFRS